MAAQLHTRSVTHRSLMYLLVALLIAAIAGIEVLHAFSADEAQGNFMCMAPSSKLEAFREMLLLHLYSH